MHLRVLDAQRLPMKTLRVGAQRCFGGLLVGWTGQEVVGSSLDIVYIRRLRIRSFATHQHEKTDRPTQPNPTQSHDTPARPIHPTAAMKLVVPALLLAAASASASSFTNNPLHSTSALLQLRGGADGAGLVTQRRGGFKAPAKVGWR